MPRLRLTLGFLGLRRRTRSKMLRLHFVRDRRLPVNLEFSDVVLVELTGCAGLVSGPGILKPSRVMYARLEIGHILLCVVAEVVIILEGHDIWTSIGRVGIEDVFCVRKEGEYLLLVLITEDIPRLGVQQQGLVLCISKPVNSGS